MHLSLLFSEGGRAGLPSGSTFQRLTRCPASHGLSQKAHDFRGSFRRSALSENTPFRSASDLFAAGCDGLADLRNPHRLFAVGDVEKTNARGESVNLCQALDWSYEHQFAIWQWFSRCSRLLRRRCQCLFDHPHNLRNDRVCGPSTACDSAKAPGLRLQIGVRQRGQRANRQLRSVRKSGVGESSAPVPFKSSSAQAVERTS